METNLRPLTLGEILDRTAQLYRSNFWLFAGIFSFYSAVWLVVGLAQLVFAWQMKGLHHATAISVGVTVVAAVAGFLLVGAAIAAISRAVASVHLGQPMTIREAYGDTLPKLGRYLWLMTLTVVRAWLPFAVVYAALIWLTVGMKSAVHAAQPGVPATIDPNAMWKIGAMIGVFLLFIPVGAFTAWMNLRYALAVPACVLENLKARAAIKRSIQLSKGARGRIFVMLLLVFVIKIGLIMVTQMFVFVALFKHHGQVSHLVSVLSQLAGFVTNTVLGPIGATGLTLFYYDQRVRTEGFDIEWMMAAAGLTGTPVGAGLTTGEGSLESGEQG